MSCQVAYPRIQLANLLAFLSTLFLSCWALSTEAENFVFKSSEWPDKLIAISSPDCEAKAIIATSSGCTVIQWRNWISFKLYWVKKMELSEVFLASPQREHMRAHTYVRRNKLWDQVDVSIPRLLKQDFIHTVSSDSGILAPSLSRASDGVAGLSIRWSKSSGIRREMPQAVEVGYSNTFRFLMLSRFRRWWCNGCLLLIIRLHFD